MQLFNSMLLAPQLEIDYENLPSAAITDIFSEEQLKAIYLLCLRVDIKNNNLKADILKELVPEGFDEIGTGTNRMAFLYNGYIFKIALDRRGMADNLAEFKRSAELPTFLAKTYETNLLINLCEYVTIIDKDDFLANSDQIRRILKEMSKAYLFDDIGVTTKNYCNWGTRNEGGRETLVILDYGYLYPLIGQNTDELFRCPRCGSRLKWNVNFTEFVCTGNDGSDRCSARVSPSVLRDAMKKDFEAVEDKILQEVYGVPVPNLKSIEQTVT